MCLILIAWQAHAAFPLVVAANRDEFFARRSASAEFWPGTSILAGRDLEGGGTWLGLARNGRFAALTNYRDPRRQQADAPTRGKLVADFLAEQESSGAYLDRVESEAARYNGFNLLLGDGAKLLAYSNVSGERHALAPGVHGLSNHLLDTSWPKVGAGRTALAQALAALPDESALFHLLRDERIHPDASLPATGVDQEWERLLSAAFVKGPGYGTRCSTLLKLGADGTASFDEQTWLAGGRAGPRRRFRFELESV